MNLEHVHTAHLRRGLRPHLTVYLGKFIRQEGSFLLEDPHARSSLSNTDVLLLLEKEGVVGYLFLKGASIVGHLLLKKARVPEGREWQVVSVGLLPVRASEERLFDTILGHIGKTLFEDVWGNNATLVRFMNKEEPCQQLLIERAVRADLPHHYLRVKFHPGGDMSRLVVSKPS